MPSRGAESSRSSGTATGRTRAVGTAFTAPRLPADAWPRGCVGSVSRKPVTGTRDGPPGWCGSFPASRVVVQAGVKVHPAVAASSACLNPFPQVRDSARREDRVEGWKPGRAHRNVRVRRARCLPTELHRADGMDAFSARERNLAHTARPPADPATRRRIAREKWVASATYKCVNANWSVIRVSVVVSE